MKIQVAMQVYILQFREIGYFKWNSLCDVLSWLILWFFFRTRDEDETEETYRFTYYIIRTKWCNFARAEFRAKFYECWGTRVSAARQDILATIERLQVVGAAKWVDWRKYLLSCYIYIDKLIHACWENICFENETLLLISLFFTSSFISFQNCLNIFQENIDCACKILILRAQVQFINQITIFFIDSSLYLNTEETLSKKI